MLTFPLRKESKMIFACFCGRSTAFFLTRKRERAWVQRNSESRRGAEVTFHRKEGHRIITETLDRESEHLIFTFDYDT